MPYTYRDLLRAYTEVGVAAGRIVYVVPELWRLRAYETSDADAIPRAHYDALREILGPEGTLVVSTASTNICNTETVFDPAETPSHGAGVLSEYVRRLPGARRSMHPFVSYAAIGPAAGFLTDAVSPHAYGPETPEARMIERDALLVSVGMAPNFSCSTAHHVEHVVGVPFRYVKEFEHPVRRDGTVRRELFYMHVWYRDIGMVKDRYAELFRRLEGRLEIKTATVGAGTVYAYSMADFYRAAAKIVAHENYISCKGEPQNRPYRR